MFWSCRCGCATENDPDGWTNLEPLIFGPSVSCVRQISAGNIIKNDHSDTFLSTSRPTDSRGFLKFSQKWFLVVGAYSERNLTVPTDKLVAMSAIALRVQEEFGLNYAAGLWRATFHEDLLWHVDRFRSLGLPERPSAYRAPGLHGLLIYCLRSVNELAEKISIVLSYITIISQMSVAACTFLDEHNSLFVSGPNQQVSHASAAWLTLSGAFPREVSSKALLATLAHPTAVKPLTPYLYHHILDALVSVGLFSEAIELLKSYWGGMVNAGADTFWECFDPTSARASPYGDVRNNSFCHAWSCTPTYFLRAKLADYLGADASDEVKMQYLDNQYIEKSCS